MVTRTGSEILYRHKIPKLISAIIAVGISVIARAPNTITATVIAPVAAAVAPLASRIGLVNTMVFTHLRANLCLIAAALAPTLEVALGLLLVRSLLSQMDVPARGAYVMSVVTPAERPAAASFTAVPRSLASSLSPSITGALFAAGAMATPLALCGVLKSVYDVALLVMFRKVPPQD